MTKESAMRVLELDATREERQRVYEGMVALVGALCYLRGLPPSEESSAAVTLISPLEGQLENENKAIAEKEAELERQILETDGPELTSKEIKQAEYNAARGSDLVRRICRRLNQNMPEQQRKKELLIEISRLGFELAIEASELQESQREYQMAQAEILAQRVLGYEH